MLSMMTIKQPTLNYSYTQKLPYKGEISEQKILEECFINIIKGLASNIIVEIT